MITDKCLQYDDKNAFNFKKYVFQLYYNVYSPFLIITDIKAIYNELTAKLFTI